ncbi:MAG: hypothetical protein SGJ05_12605 [bacterium]|nr:hypothetical protein [bacterium]
MNRELVFIDEPALLFGHNQVTESPKDGLFMFGPLDASTNQMRIGVIGTRDGLTYFNKWARRLGDFIPARSGSTSPQHRPFPGFDAVFNSAFPVIYPEITIADQEWRSALFINDRWQAIYKTVEIFASRILQHRRQEDAPVDVWYVVIPEDIYKHGRPNPVSIPSDLRVKGKVTGGKKLAKQLITAIPLFQEDAEDVVPYNYEVNFHNQLKARLLDADPNVVVQIVRETMLSPSSFVDIHGRPIRKVQDEATIAWNFSTTSYFKSGQRPWRLASVRPRVCYIGLVYKRPVLSADERMACCGAQMFLDSADGLVFRGAVGPWYSGRAGEFHLPRTKARELIKLIVEAYRDKHGAYPQELFLHGQTFFRDEEWEGFKEAVPSETSLVGVRIRRAGNIKFFRLDKHPVLRGTGWMYSDRRGYLWTTGYVPYLQTYAGRETPSPISVDIVRGEADLKTVMSDIMGLTKLNFNSCIYNDGIPVTLRFANSVGEILTAGPVNNAQRPLPFKHYI